MTTALLLAACFVSYVGGTGAVRRFNTIPIRAVSTGLLLVAFGLLAIEVALRFPAPF